MSRGGARVWGNEHPAAQLTDKKVIRYRNLVRSGKATVGELAAKEGCSHGRISMAVRGETWQHLNDVAAPVPAAQRRTAAKVAATKRGAQKAAPLETAPQKAGARKGVAKAPVAKKSVAKKLAIKKATIKKTALKKTTPKRATVRR